MLWPARLRATRTNARGWINRGQARSYVPDCVTWFRRSDFSREGSKLRTTFGSTDSKEPFSGPQSRLKPLLLEGMRHGSGCVLEQGVFFVGQCGPRVERVLWPARLRATRTNARGWINRGQARSYVPDCVTWFRRSDFSREGSKLRTTFGSTDSKEPFSGPQSRLKPLLLEGMRHGSGCVLEQGVFFVGQCGPRVERVLWPARLRATRTNASGWINRGQPRS